MLKDADGFLTFGISYTLFSMKAFSFLLLATASLTWVSCQKELGPVIDFSVPGSTAVDTTYEAAPEAATPKRVLIEEFTGVTCPNCPAGHRAIKTMIDANPGRISAIGYQPFNIAQANPAPETHSDNRTQKATDLGKSFGGVPYLPCATFNRVPEEGEFLRARPYWTTMLDNRLKESAPMNMTLASTYDSSNRELKVTVRVAYTAEVATKHRLTVALTEDNIIDAQEESLPGGGPIITHPDYEHTHVFRDFLSSVTGDNVLDSIAVKRPGRVYERRYTLKLDSKWNAANCAVTAFVHNEDNGQKNILQVVDKTIR